jgi:hypothetical protein
MAEQIKFGDNLYLQGERLVLDNGTNAGVISSENGTVKIEGNLTVTGTTTTVNSETVTFADSTLLLNSNETGTPSEDGGIEIERGTATNKLLTWSESSDKWTVGAETFVAGKFEGPLTGTTTGLHLGGLDTQGADLLSTGLSELNDVRIWLGSINDTTIGAITPSTGVFTTISGTLTGTVSSIANHTTDDLAEGSTNLYYTQARVDARYATLHTDADAGTLDGQDGTYYLDYNNFTNTPASAIDWSSAYAGTIHDTNIIWPANIVRDNSHQALHYSSALSISGNTITLTKGDTSTESIVVPGTDITGSVIPATDNTYTLGTSALKYSNIYGHSVEATFADLAERYATDVPYLKGTVVVFGGEAEITTTTEAKDVSVAGVISTNPALKMNADAGNSQTHPYVALRGRVPCNFIGPVSKGDLIVTADNEPGYAQSIGKNDAGRSVFAKSLETDLTEGKKLIEVVIL